MAVSKRMQQVAMAAGGAGFSTVIKGLRARVDAYAKLAEWHGDQFERSYDYLAKLCNHPNPAAFSETMRDEDIRLCKLLAGPHGYTVYKMLLARRKK